MDAQSAKIRSLNLRLLHLLVKIRKNIFISVVNYHLQGRVKERELSWVREVPSGLIGCALASLGLRVVEWRGIQTGDISFVRDCIISL